MQRAPSGSTESRIAMTDKTSKAVPRDDLDRHAERLQAELELMHSVNYALVSASGLDDTLQQLLDGITRTLGYEAADIQLLTDDRRQLVYSALSVDSGILKQVEKVIGFTVRGLTIPLFRNSVNWNIIVKGEPLITDDINRIFADFSDSRSLRKLAPMVARITGFKYVIRVPLRSASGIIGLMSVASGSRLGQEDLEVMQHFAGQVGLAVEKARLEQQLREYSEHLETMVKERTRELEAINQIAATVSRSLNIDVILKNALAKVLEVLSLKVGAVFITDDKQVMVNLIFHQGLPEDVVEALSEVKVGQGFPGLVVKEGKPIVDNDLAAQAVDDPLLWSHPEFKSMAAVPLESKGSVRGVLVLLSEDAGRFSDAEAAMLVTIGSEVGVALENAWLYEKSSAHSRKMEELSITDSLTGLSNRRHFYRRLKSEMARAIRQQHPLSLLVVDLDNLKGYNDKHGHLKGDESLRGVAQAIRAGIRQNVDTGYRHGGDEFAVILPYSDQDEALVVAERIRKTFAGFSFPGTSLSIGVAQQDGEERVDDLVTRADTAMYVAKNFGGNRVYVEKK
ncbi:MAG: sensor domain-containing diguanylate cyclase [Thermoleophilia bacterium]